MPAVGGFRGGRGGGRGRGRAFMAHAAARGGLQGTMIDSGVPCRVLFDSGPSHSFISRQYCMRRKLLISMLRTVMCVDTPMGSSVDLNEHVIKHPAATFFIKVAGDSMKNAGICHNDLLVVDRSLVAKNNSIVVALINQEFTVKRLIKNPHEIKLKAENPRYPDILVSPECEFEIWGVVTHVIHYFIS